MFSEHIFLHRHPSIGTFTFQSGPTVSPLIWKQQGLALVGDAEGSVLGYSVALSNDARTVVMGALDYNNDTGYVKVIIPTTMAETGCCSARPSTEMQRKIILGSL
jgi:hypothetical protein